MPSSIHFFGVRDPPSSSSSTRESQQSLCALSHQRAGRQTQSPHAGLFGIQKHFASCTRIKSEAPLATALRQVACPAVVDITPDTERQSDISDRASAQGRTPSTAIWEHKRGAPCRTGTNTRPLSEHYYTFRSIFSSIYPFSSRHSLSACIVGSRLN